MNMLKRKREFPGCLVVRIPGFYHCDLGSISGQGTEIPQVKNKERLKVNELSIQLN